MYAGKLVFAQIMEHLPLHTFRRIMARYAGERKVKSFSCLDQFLCIGVRTTDLSAEPARHRSVSARPALEVVPPRDSLDGRTQYARQCECGARLAHLRRLCAGPDSHRAPAVCRRTVRGRLEGVGLRPGYDHHRFVPVGVFVGAIDPEPDHV